MTAVGARQSLPASFWSAASDAAPCAHSRSAGSASLQIPPFERAKLAITSPPSSRKLTACPRGSTSELTSDLRLYQKACHWVRRENEELLSREPWESRFRNRRSTRRMVLDTWLSGHIVLQKSTNNDAVTLDKRISRRTVAVDQKSCALGAKPYRKPSDGFARVTTAASSSSSNSGSCL